MKIIFAGTPDFSVPSLKTLIESEHDVIAVYTQPDRKAGRGRKLQASPVKQTALDHDIPVYQPKTLRDEDAQKELAALDADLMVVTAYGLILPQVVLDTPKHGCINVHASILPRWRGAAPIQRAILAGDTESGVTIMQMSLGLDEGDMLEISRCDIEDNETGQSLHDKLSTLGNDALLSAISKTANGTLTPQPQDESLVTYAHKLSKEEAQIDWSQPAIEIERQIRAFNAWPVSHTEWQDKVLRIWLAKATDETCDKAPGTIIRAEKAGIDVATGNGTLRITQLQLPGKRAMQVADAINANEFSGCFGS